MLPKMRFYLVEYYDERVNGWYQRVMRAVSLVQLVQTLNADKGIISKIKGEI